MACAAAIQRSMPSDEWVSIDVAARKTSEPVRTWRWRAKQESDAAAREGRASLAFQGSPPTGTGRQVWYVHRSMHTLLARVVDQAVKDREALIAKYPAHLVERALRRRVYLDRWRKLCRESSETEIVAAERIVAEARRTEAASFRISVRSMARWWREFNQAGVAGLVDRYAAPAGSESNRSPEAVEWFYELYHCLNKLAVQTCHEMTLREARRKRWAWPSSYTATTSWLRTHDDLSLTYLMREGKEAWAHRYLPHLELDYSKLEPGEMFVCDHTPCDFWVTYKDRQIRPWLTAIQDLKSRCIVGHHVGPTPHQDAILSALRMAFRDWAIPRVLKIDNGKDFASKAIVGVTKKERARLRKALGPDWQQAFKRGEHLVDCTDPRWLGITGELDIAVSYALPYSPQSKATLERWFRTFEEQHGKTYATYTGNRPGSRPEALDEILSDPASVPSMEDAQTRIGEYLDIYHRSVHGTLGQTPLAVWHTATRLRRAVDAELAALVGVRGLYKVGANGISLRVGGATLTYGAKSAALKRYVGRKVLIGLDSNDLSHVWAYTPDEGRHKIIARLEPNERIEPYTCADDAREAIADKKREQAIMHKASRSYANRTKTVAQRASEHARAKRGELMATGTEGGHPAPRIVPVHTGFESVSNASRSTFETPAFRPEDVGDIEDLFDGPERLGVVDDGYDEEDMEDLFGDEPAIDTEPDEGLDEL